jgi:hypothetical protein
VQRVIGSEENTLAELNLEFCSRKQRWGKMLIDVGMNAERGM